MSQLTEAEEFLTNLVNQAKQKPLTLRSKAGDEAVVLSREHYELLASEHQQKLGNFKKAWQELGKEAARNGLTEGKLTGLLNDQVAFVNMNGLISATLKISWKGFYDALCKC
jgi:PHD/YefM family antitoxin component YafN of YafNO toxin-antitoxin module